MCGDRNSRASRGVGGGKCHLLSRGGEINSRRGRGSAGGGSGDGRGPRARDGGGFAAGGLPPSAAGAETKRLFFPPPPFQRLTDSLVFYSAAAS